MTNKRTKNNDTTTAYLMTFTMITVNAEYIVKGSKSDDSDLKRKE